MLTEPNDFPTVTALTTIQRARMLSHDLMDYIAHQAPLTMGFPREEHWSGLPFPPPVIFPTPGLNPRLVHWQVESLPRSHQGSQ